MKYFQSIKTEKHGFSLVEMIVIIALYTLLMLAIMDSISAFYRINAYTIAQAYQVDYARRGTDIMVRDLREMTYADDGTFPLAIMEDYKVGFYSDVDRDDSVEYIEYSLSSTTLYKKIYSATGSPPVYATTTPESTTTLSEYVQNSLQNTPLFVYYDNAGLSATATTTVTDIRYIRTNVIVNVDPIRDPGEYVLRSSASLRNLK
jgi:type II secretory pathway pseudopilin PulG